MTYTPISIDASGARTETDSPETDSPETDSPETDSMDVVEAAGDPSKRGGHGPAGR